MYSPGGSQCQVMDWIGFDGLARNQGKTDTLGESGEQQMYICLDLSCHDMFLVNAPDA